MNHISGQTVLPLDGSGVPLPDGTSSFSRTEPGSGSTRGTPFKDPAFTENRAQPVHRWVPWIAGFSAGFVDDCLTEYLPEATPNEAVVCDPFAGVGTTLVAAHHRGFSTAGFEINPWAALAARSKLAAGSVSLAEFSTWRAAYREFMAEAAGSGQAPDLALVPPGFRSRIPFFSPAVLRQVLWTLRFFQGIGDAAIRDLFLVSFGSVMIRFSNYSYEPSLASRPGAGKPLIEDADVAGIMVAKLREMADDCAVVQRDVGQLLPAPPTRVIQDSIFHADQYLPPNTVDLAITSPPYLNNYHYVRNTRPHLFWLNFIADTAGLRDIEHASFGKFWQTVRDRERVPLDVSLPGLEALLEDLRSRNSERGPYGGPGWANYAAQYFNDTARLCAVFTHLLKPGGRIVVVIGNSILQGLEIPVDEFLAQIGELEGLEREAIHRLRAKRVGNSIIRSSVRTDAGSVASLYEVAVVLRKP